MDIPSHLSQELVNAVRTCLENGQFKEALNLPEDNKYVDVLKNNCWDLIPHLINKIENDTIITWPALQKCCEKLLQIVAERANPEEVLLELIEEIEIIKNDAQFIAILKPLQISLNRVTVKMGRSLEWCINTIRFYISKLPLPPTGDLSQSEKLLLDCDDNARRIVKIYFELPTFYNYYVIQIVENRKISSIRNIMLCFLVDLLGNPFASMDMEYDGKTKSQTRILAEQIFNDIYKLNENVYIYLQYAYQKCHTLSKVDDKGVFEDAPIDVFLFDENLSPIALGVLYYLLFSEKLSAPLLPLVYSPIYICHETLSLSVYLLKQNECSLQYKGVKLGCALLNFLPIHAPSTLLSYSEHKLFVETLSTVAVYSSAECVRKESIILLKNYIFKFDDKGRYLIIHNLLPFLQHPGIIGYTINIYKDILSEAYNSCDERLLWFKGKYLKDILQITCKLEHGAETDLVEIADLIISNLNLLRFLSLKDTMNRTGFWDYVKNIELEYLGPLRKGLEMSRAHYDVKFDDLVNSKGPKISLTVAGTVLDTLPIENKKDVISSSLNALHLIDSLLSRLQECLELYKH